MSEVLTSLEVVQEVRLGLGHEPLEGLLERSGLQWDGTDDLTEIGLDQRLMLKVKDVAYLRAERSMSGSFGLIKWGHIGLRQAYAGIRAAGWKLGNIRQVLTLLTEVQEGRLQLGNPEMDTIYVQGTEFVLDDLDDVDDDRALLGFVKTRFIPVIYWRAKRIRWGTAAGFNKYSSTRFFGWRPDVTR